ncbi:MAG: hypothetical protein PHT69_11985 [Bacteroidales bacterium]|nr:hypothetical protein [Bacteroidales bacterium]
METPLEKVLISYYKTEMISYLHTHPNEFEEAVALALSDKQPFAWRAAWLLWSCMDKNDPRMQGYIGKIINVLPTKNDGHQRELIKILSLMEIGEEHEGFLFNICVSLWEKTNKKPSVRLNAFYFIVKIANKYPELIAEILLLAENQYLESLSPGVKECVSRLIKQLPRK